MSDVVTLARTARETLARALSALQGDPNVPSQILDLATPIAQSMGALHQIERSGGAQLVPNAQAALTNVQTALAQLQSQPTQQRAVASAIEAVASALGSVHALTRAAQPQPAARSAPQPDAGQAAPVQPGYPQPQAYAAAAQPSSQAARPAPAPQHQPAPGQAAAQAPRAPGPPSDAPVLAAELGAHSPSNFYKGLSGNDIVDHGGLFVATYKLPKLGARVRLKVSLPGGYEFEANAVVRWRREASDSAGDAPPGFGAQFTDIATEARQLVYRYVRNREPMFHDDL